MTRKLLMLAGMLGVCACSLFVRPALAVFPTCTPSYCHANPNATCQCPPGTKAYPNGAAPCLTWHGDCNFF
jgi:hypothetical protein